MEKEFVYFCRHFWIVLRDIAPFWAAGIVGGSLVSVYEDSIVVYPKEFHRPTEPICAHNDHRIVMALSVLLTITGGELCGAEAISKSYPTFFEDLKKLNLTWYDGGLICEIVDKRRQREKISHVHLKVKSSDIGPLTYEREQDFLLNRYPLLCLDPDLHVTDVARTIKADAERWIQPITHEVKEQGEDMEDTTPQPQKEPITTLLPPQESTEELRDKLVKYLLQSRENQM